MNSDQSNFVNVEFPELLKKLTAETPAKWGQMNAQQMVEHLTDYVRIATGKNPVSVQTSEEQLPAFRRFLEGEKQFRPETKNPLNPGPPNPVRTASIEDAIAEYLSEMKDFYAAFEKEPGKKTAHPSFGYLSSEDWMKMQYKHLMHHGRQFGLVVGE